MYMAIFETPTAENYAFGDTPKDAIEALIKFYQKEMQFPEYLAQYREDIRVIPATPGTVAHLGVADKFWPAAIGGDDASFNELWGEYYPERRPAP